jgi:hypothetical protein
MDTALSLLQSRYEGIVSYFERLKLQMNCAGELEFDIALTSCQRGLIMLIIHMWHITCMVE